MCFAAGDELQNRRLWDLAGEFQKKVSLKLTNKLNYKYGWQSNDELEDTAQDLFLITYEALLKYERKNNLIIHSLLDLDENIIKHLKNEIIMSYRLKVWHNRSDSAIRMSDIYNIEKGSLEDINVKFYQNNEDIIVNNDNNNTYKDKREQIISILTTILQEDMRNIINKYLFGDDKYDILTHKEIALQHNTCRSAVTRRINRGFKKLSDFIKKYKIKLNQILYPTDDDMQYILACTNKVIAHNSKNTKDNMKKKAADIIHINSKKQKNTVLPKYLITIHNIEEYLYA